MDVTADTTTLYASDRDVFLFLIDDLNSIEAGRLSDGSPDLYFRGFYCWNSEVGAKALGIASFYIRAVVCQSRNLWGVEGLPGDHQIPGFDGALFTPRWKEVVWAKFRMGAPQRQRRSIERQHSQESLKVLARRLYALQATIPQLPRSSLHRCFQRHAISRLPDVEGEKPRKQEFKTCPVSFFHIDIAEVRSEEGTLHLYVAVDRTSKFVFAGLHDKADQPTAAAFLEALLRAVPCRLHTILTDNAIQFADLPKNRDGPSARFGIHRFGQTCRANGIEHRLAKPNHPWTNGQVERMTRTIKKATVKRCPAWSHEPDRFIADPTHQPP